MVNQLVVVGAGGFGREVLDVVAAINASCPVWNVLGVVDDAPSQLNLDRLATRGMALIGSLSDFPVGVHVSIGIGAPAVRRAVTTELTRRSDVAFATLIHPTATLGSEAKVGVGSVICAGVSIGTNVTLGAHVHLNPHVVVGHDTRLDDHVSVNPNATISGDCHVEECVLIGAAALVLQGLTVGRDATVGGSACVTGDVMAGCVVTGVPALPRERRGVGVHQTGDSS